MKQLHFTKSKPVVTQAPKAHMFSVLQMQLTKFISLNNHYTTNYKRHFPFKHPAGTITKEGNLRREGGFPKIAESRSLQTGSDV